MQSNLYLSKKGWCIGYAHGSTIVDVAGNNFHDGVWLTELFCPWCKTTDHGKGDVCVRISRSDKAANDLDRTFGLTRSEMLRVPCFTLDTQTVILPGWKDADRLWLADTEAHCFYGITYHAKSIDLVAGTNQPQARLGLLRLIRELIAGVVLSTKKVVDMHAAAFSVNGKGVLLAGSKGAGKTSLLCHVMGSTSAALLSNDRVFVHFEDTIPILRGVPTMVSIRPKTLDVFPILRTPCGSVRSAHKAKSSSPPGLHLTPAEFAGRLSSGRVSSAVLHAIVLPEISDSLDTWSLELLSHSAAETLLESCLYGAANVRTETTVFGTFLREGGTTGLLPPKQVAHFLPNIPVYRCKLGPSAYRESALPLLHALGIQETVNDNQR